MKLWTLAWHQWRARDHNSFGPACFGRVIAVRAKIACALVPCKQSFSLKQIELVENCHVPAKIALHSVTVHVRSIVVLVGTDQK